MSDLINDITNVNIYLTSNNMNKVMLIL